MVTHSPPIGTGRVLPTVPPSTPATPPTHLLSLPWQFLRLTDGGKQVEISLTYGGCTTFEYAQVAQGPRSVEITTWGTSTATRRTVCPAFAAILHGTVTLDAPLGSRQLLHGPVARSGFSAVS
jgi:hypothetical protein